MPTKVSALALFTALSLDEVRAEITKLDAEIDAIEKRRDMLRTLEKALDIRDHGKKPRASRKRKGQAEKDGSHSDEPVVASKDVGETVEQRTAGRQPSPETVALRNRIFQHLRMHGPQKIGDISRNLSVEYGKVQNALFGQQFRKLDDGRWACK